MGHSTGEIVSGSGSVVISCRRETTSNSSLFLPKSDNYKDPGKYSKDKKSFFFPVLHASGVINGSSAPPSSTSKKFLVEPLRIFSHLRMEHLVAGVSGGVASTLILHPLDLVKIRFAVSDGLSSRPQYNGLYDAFKSILTNEGVKGLYR
jgi:hypothetical protein